MFDQIRILSARRAYEFTPDHLRLTVLSTAVVQEKIQSNFRFQVAQVATPLATFGPVPSTIPPGVVFDYGVAPFPESSATPIRFLHFEPQRIVIDIAGPSSTIDWIFQELRGLLAEMLAPDESPVIGEPARIADYSEISAHFDFSLEKLVSRRFRSLTQRTFGQRNRSRRVIPVSVKFQATGVSEELYPAEIGSMQLSKGQMIDIRAGTRPEDRIYFSATNLPTDSHIAWLKQLNEELK